MAFDKAAPVYAGKDPDMKQIAEYENYLREQLVHEIELLNRKVEELKKQLGV